MISLKNAGFTIVEVMLFLGISGLLFLGVIIGTGGAINSQRYRDSVSSFQSVLQQQFSEVSNVINESTSVICGADTVNRGQSNCVVLGKYITSTDGKVIRIQNVIGQIDPDIESSSNDVTALQDSNPIAISGSESSYELDWGTSIKNTANNDMTFSILMLRSPSSGLIRTFINDSNVVAGNNLKAGLITPSALNVQARMCIEPNGLTNSSQIEVRFNANSTSPSGVEVFGDSTPGYAC